MISHRENCNNRRSREDNTLRLSGIKKYAIEDGVGIRTSIYSCMCYHKCEGCHNPHTWDYENGYSSTIAEVFDLILENTHGGVTFSGGDPFVQWKQFYELANMIKTKTDKTIWCYTGYTYEYIVNDDKMRLLLEQCDVLVDGRFVKEEKDLSLKFRGSRNQRLIDVKKSLSIGEVVLYEA